MPLDRAKKDEYNANQRRRRAAMTPTQRSAASAARAARRASRRAAATPQQRDARQAVRATKKQTRRTAFNSARKMRVKTQRHDAYARRATKLKAAKAALATHAATHRKRTHRAADILVSLQPPPHTPRKPRRPTPQRTRVKPHAKSRSLPNPAPLRTPPPLHDVRMHKPPRRQPLRKPRHRLTWAQALFASPTNVRSKKSTAAAKSHARRRVYERESRVRPKRPVQTLLRMPESTHAHILTRPLSHTTQSHPRTMSSAHSQSNASVDFFSRLHACETSTAVIETVRAEHPDIIENKMRNVMFRIFVRNASPQACIERISE